MPAQKEKLLTSAARSAGMLGDHTQEGHLVHAGEASQTPAVGRLIFVELGINDYAGFTTLY